MNNLNELANYIHATVKAKGFWDKPRETGTLLMLIVTELSEAMEAYRNNKHANKISLVELLHDNNPKSFVKLFENFVKDTFEDEITDVFIQLFDFIGFLQIDIKTHLALKMKFNLTRPYKHGKPC
jgi:NTP pyrophosphatase (non-canonical NTP hydrolase)